MLHVSIPHGIVISESAFQKTELAMHIRIKEYKNIIIQDVGDLL
jgi:hypothetical protein